MSHRPTAKSIFHRALEQLPHDRAAFLDQACGEQFELRQRVEALLRAHDDAGNFMEKPVVDFQGAAGAPVLDDAKENDRDTGITDRDTPSLDFLEPCDRPDRIGTLGHYEIIEFIGRGGMGIVLRGLDAKLNRIVAIKVLAPGLASNTEACQRFLEGQAAAAINHDHVVTIYGIDDGGRLPFIVMEYVPGQSLQQTIDQTEFLKLHEILRFGKQVALGLAAAHDEGLIHRDIKPANILLENSVHRVKITDFGLARAVDDVSITRSGTVAGTPQYMSPEQARGDAVDHRSDLFSLGGVLYAMCSGRPPFHADSTVAMIRRVCEDEPRPLQEVNPDIPNWLVEIIDRLLDKDREARLQSATEVADLLGQHLLHLQQPEVNPQPPSVLKGARRSSFADRIWANRRAWFTAAAAALLLVVGLAAAEYSGVTRFTRTVIRLVQGEGTLVIMVDDPNIEVEVAEEELVFKGAGINEIHVRPGQYTVLARKDGRRIHSEVVSIDRNGRRIVTVFLEETPLEMVVRPVLQDFEDWTYSGQPSPHGNLISYVDLNTGNLGVYDLVTKKYRPLTDTSWPQQAFHSIFSPDGQQIAYQFLNKKKFWELRIVGVDGTDSRPLFSNEEIGVSPVAWFGEHILAIFLTGFFGVDQERQLALISVRDGSVRKLKTLRDSPQRPMSFSPDGKYIAFSHEQEGSETHRDISVLAADGTQETRLIENPADDFVLGWTPDGTGLVFASDRTGTFHAFTIQIAEGAPHGEPRIARSLGPITPMGFTKRGSFFYGRDLPADYIFLATVNMETGAVQTQPTRAFLHHQGYQSAPDWSPDGKSLACRSESNLAWLVRSIETGQIHELSPKGKLSRNFHSLRWSPDGQNFLYANLFNVLKMDVKTREVTELLTEGRRVLDADWSRDGKAVFYADRPRPGIGEPQRVVRRQLDSGEEMELCRIAEHVLWLTVSPNGQRLALLTENRAEGDERAVKLVPATGGEPQELIKVEGITRGLAWTNDGQYLLYGLERGKQTELWRVAVEGGISKQLGLKVDGYMRHLRVHPIDGKQIAFNLSTFKSDLWVIENFFASLVVDR